MVILLLHGGNLQLVLALNMHSSTRAVHSAQDIASLHTFVSHKLSLRSRSRARVTIGYISYLCISPQIVSHHSTIGNSKAVHICISMVSFTMGCSRWDIGPNPLVREKLHIQFGNNAIHNNLNKNK